MVWGKLYDIKGFNVSVEKIFEYYLLFIVFIYFTYHPKSHRKVARFLYVFVTLKRKFKARSILKSKT